MQPPLVADCPPWCDRAHAAENAGIYKDDGFEIMEPEILHTRTIGRSYGPGLMQELTVQVELRQRTDSWEGPLVFIAGTADSLPLDQAREVAAMLAEAVGFAEQVADGQPVT